jgi:hypothetical protein
MTRHFENTLYNEYENGENLLNRAFVLFVLMQYTAYSLNELGRFNSEEVFS